jgi:hypothetical protein
MINHFIHHPIIQNDRRKAGDSSSSISCEIGKTGTTTGTTGCVIEIEQFPALCTGTVSTPSVQTKLNFKEMMLKSATSSSGGGSTVSASNDAVGQGSGSGSGPGSTAPSFPVPKVRTEYAAQQQTPQKALSSGNIFLAAFYGLRDNEYCDEDDIDDDEGGGGGGGGGGSGGSGGVISSTLIDSCDRKYDRLYR